MNCNYLYLFKPIYRAAKSGIQPFSNLTRKTKAHMFGEDYNDPFTHNILSMASYKYELGDAEKIEQLFPPPGLADPKLGFHEYADVIKHYTINSLHADAVNFQGITVTKDSGRYFIQLDSTGEQDILEAFGRRHAMIFSEQYAQKAIRGMELLKELKVWNPMEGFHVNASPTDGTSKWHLFPSLGLNVMNQKAILLLHYPPWAIVQLGTFENAITFRRWEQLLTCAGISDSDASLYKTFMEVSPIAAPGSGESEYPNDYFPIMMASGFFDGGPDRDYIRSMLELFLNPPGWPEDRKYTLPLLICGSPLYDPQSPGWFRTAYTDILPKDEHGIPQVNVLQTGTFKVFPNSKRETPYLISNHMIAAGVTGKCTDDPSQIPDIRQYEAQDMVSASFLKIYSDDPEISPQDAKSQACMRWFGNPGGTGVPKPKDENDQLTLCALAQMDLFFEPNPPRPKYTFAQALERCKTATDPGNPCCGNIKSAGNDKSINIYCISSDRESGKYQLWAVDPDSTSLFTEIKSGAENSIPKNSNLIQVGNYILEWSDLDTDNKYAYRLLQFNPEASNPLGSFVADPTQDGKLIWSEAAVQAGVWSKSKFFCSRQDFANPDGAKKGFESGSELILISMHNFVLNFIPTEGRGTNQLFNFDPGSSDPLPAPYSPQGSWLTIESGHELSYVNGYVLDRNIATSDFTIWQFDPQAEGSLSYPPIREGNWTEIRKGDRLSIMGEYILQWDPSSNNFWLRKFDLENETGMSSVLQKGTLPKSVTYGSTLTFFETLIPLNIELKSKPGTMDFMRDKIQHVIYYMIENRSFDHVCGWLYEKGEKFHVVGPDGPYRGVDENFKNSFRGKEYAITKYHDGKLSPDINLDLDQQDPYHDNSDVLRQMFYPDINNYFDKKKPGMGGFAYNNGTAEVMQGYTPEQLPVLNGLAKNYAISDDWFSSTPSGTTVNRAFSLTGSTLARLNNFQNGSEYLEWSQYPHRPSIWKVMWANGIKDFKLYNSVEWIECKYTYNLFLKGQIPSIDSPFVVGNYVPQLNQFFDDLKYGTLPKFSFLEPKWVTFTGSTSYHPGNDLIPGERELNDIFTAIQSSPLWNNTLLVITFDEHGGLPDHVAPPYATKPWANDSFNGFTSDIMGVRVPTILVSPYITSNTVFRSDTGTSYDSTSILSTLLNWMGIPKSRWGLGERTNHAPTFENAFCEAQPRTDKVVLDLPYDKNFPKESTPGISSHAPVLPVHDLHRLLVPGMIASMTPNMDPSERKKMTDEILDNAVSLQDLHKRLDALHRIHNH